MSVLFSLDHKTDESERSVDPIPRDKRLDRVCQWRPIHDMSWSMVFQRSPLPLIKWAFGWYMLYQTSKCLSLYLMV